MRIPSILAAVMVCTATLPSAGARSPVVVYVGEPHEGAIVYGPADMLCDLHLCRMFGVPTMTAVPKGAVVEFGIPRPTGQGAIDLRRCLQVCRASVLGYPSPRTSAQTFPGQAVFITPVELRLD